MQFFQPIADPLFAVRVILSGSLVLPTQTTPRTVSDARILFLASARSAMRIVMEKLMKNDPVRRNPLFQAGNPGFNHQRFCLPASDLKFSNLKLPDSGRAKSRKLSDATLIFELKSAFHPSVFRRLALKPLALSPTPPVQRHLYKCKQADSRSTCGKQIVGLLVTVPLQIVERSKDFRFPVSARTHIRAHFTEVPAIVNIVFLALAPHHSPLGDSLRG